MTGNWLVCLLLVSAAVPATNQQAHQSARVVALSFVLERKELASYASGYDLVSDTSARVAASTVSAELNAEANTLGSLLGRGTGVRRASEALRCGAGCEVLGERPVVVVSRMRVVGGIPQVRIETFVTIHSAGSTVRAGQLIDVQVEMIDGDWRAVKILNSITGSSRRP